jgi:DNA-binding SARP family transcriptional activator
MSMRFSVLGPVRVAHGEHPVPIGRPRRRAVLAYLLINANRPVSVERLVEALWQGTPPGTARDQIQSEISAVRREIRGHATDLIITTCGGYSARLAPGELDLDEFTTTMARARTAAGDGHVDRGVRLVHAALQLWRGPALADAVGGYVPAARARLEEQRITAEEYLVELELAGGRHEEILDRLAGLAAEYPLRERLRGHLVLALYRSGRRAEALATIRELRLLLADGEGLDPGPSVIALERLVLRDDPSLQLVPAGALPRQLPPDIGDFVGRRAELTSLQELLNGSGRYPVTVCLAGSAGSGKTALTIRAAHELADRYADGCVFFDLRGTGPTPPGPYQVAGSILRSLGLPGAAIPADYDARLAVYRSALAPRNLLVVLDDAADERQVRPLMPTGPGCGLLVTSRRPLVGLDGAHLVEIGPLDERDGLTLLAGMVGPARVAVEGESARRLIEFGGGLPLSIRVVGRRFAQGHARSLAQLADRLADGRSEQRPAGSDDGSPVSERSLGVAGSNP